jgi:hypothetical protein
MTPKPALHHKNIGQDLKSLLEGKLEPQKLEAAAKTLGAMTQAYPANGSIASFIFYLQIQVTVTSPGGKTFNGKAGGISTPGGGALFGDVYTDDINALYANTHSFAFTSTPAYFAVYFFDSSSNGLGTFQAGAVSTVAGTGGGTGNWS